MFLLALASQHQAYAQSNWLRKAGGTGLDEALDVARSTLGSVYMGGYFSGNATFASTSLQSAGLADAVVVGYSSDGVPQWANRFGGVGTDKILSVACDNNYVVVTGFFFETINVGSFELTAADSGDVFVAKMNTAGVVLWAKSAGGIFGDAANGIALAPNGDVVITGEFRGDANFGPIAVSSVDGLNGQATTDVFTAKLDDDGNWLWVETGGGELIDRGLDVDMDNTGNVFITGTFSNNITFDQLHVNDIVNAGFVVKYNANGQEQFFVKIAATQVVPAAIRELDGQVYVCGEGIGQTIYFGTNSLVVPATNDFSWFLAKISGSGQIVWAQEDASENYVAARCMDVLSTGIYVGGVFRCTMTEYATALEEGLFNSVGYSDSFAAQYNLNGDRMWMRQYGGPKDDGCTGIAAGLGDVVIMAGSFEKIFNAPEIEGYFVSNATNFNPPLNNANYVYPNDQSANCGYQNYGNFISVNASGNKDMWLGRLYDADLPHYDYYSRGPCDFDVVEPCIGEVAEALSCTASLTECGQVRLFGNLNTGSDCFIGPEYLSEWNTGANTLFLDVTTSGTYSWTVERKDGCATFTDSIEVVILPLPIPLVTDDQGINLQAPPNADPIQLCAPATVNLEGEVGPNQTGYWVTPGGNIPSENIVVTESAQYEFVLVGENGCEAGNSINVDIIVPLEEIDPLLEYDGSVPIDQGDTIIVCGNILVPMHVIDLLDQDNFSTYTNVIWSVVMNDQMIQQPEDGVIEYEFYPEGTGWYEITALPYFHVDEPCPIDTVWYPEQTFEFYLIELEAPLVDLNIVGGTALCPGDTLTLTASGNTDFVWSGPGVSGSAASSILVTSPGAYSISGSIVFENGCEDESTVTAFVNFPPTPVLSTNPNHNILCPNETIELVAPASDQYTWIGPLGQVLGNTQSIVTAMVGPYYCVLNTAGCIQESNVLTIQAYATPYLVALPSYDLCLEGYVTLAAQASPQATINWLPPLSGSSSTINVFLPNTYEVEINFCNITTIASVTITQNTPEPTIQAVANNLCPGEVTQLFGPPGMETYLWSPGNHASINYDVMQEGTYILSVTDTNGCVGSSAPFEVVYYPIAPPTIPNTSVCFGATASFTASGNNVFWSLNPSGDPVVASGNSWESAPVLTTTLVYVFREDANCRSLVDPIVIEVTPGSQMDIINADTLICAGSLVELMPSDPSVLNADYLWTTPLNETVEQPILVLNNPTQNLSGWYILQVETNNCLSIPDSVFIAIEDPFQPVLIDDATQMHCVGHDVLLVANLSQDDMYWSTPQGIVEGEMVSIPQAQLDAEGLYIVYASGTVCSEIFDTVQVELREYPVFDLQPEDVYCEDGYMTAHIEEGFDNYVWNSGDTDADAIVPLGGYVYVEVTNWPSCTVTDSLYVENIDCIDDFPNVFTPNGDGDNDYVDFGWLRIPIDEVHIYNRWGNLIRRLVGEPFVWNGRNDSGELVSDGVYYYVITSPNAGGQFHNVEGYIHTLGSGNGTNGQ